MESRTKKTSRSIPLKLISLLLGYTFWHIFGNSYTTTAWITIPLCFYNIPAQKSIRGPETLSIKIAGKRTDLRSLDTNELAIHVNAAHLREGKNALTITSDTIFLPKSIKLVHYSPSNPTVELIQEQKLG